jgi:hypothetical protein
VPTPIVPTLLIIVQFRPIIDLIQKFRLSESTIDSNYSINSVDVIINGGNMGVPQLPQGGPQMSFPQQPGQYVWVPQASYSKPPGGNGNHVIREPRVYKFSKGSDPNAQGGGGRFSSSRGGKSDKRGMGTSIDRGARNSRGDYSSRGTKTRPRKIDLLGGTSSPRHLKGAIKSVIVRLLLRRPVLIKLPV